MILLTGVTGTIGREVARLLRAAGVPFRALVRSPEKAASLAGPGVETVIGDFEEPQTLAPALAGVDRLFLLSAFDLRQVELKANVIAAARGAGVGQVVLASGSGAGLDSPLVTGRWSGETQKQIEDAGMAHTYLQPTFFMQNMLMFADSIARQGAFYLPLKDAAVSYVDARDIAAVAVRALTEPGHEGKAYPLTGPEALTCAAMAGILSRAAGKTVTYVNVSLEDAKEGMTQAGMPGELADALNELYALAADGHAAAVVETVEAVTGRPARTFARFVEDHATAFA